MGGGVHFVYHKYVTPGIVLPLTPLVVIRIIHLKLFIFTFTGADITKNDGIYSAYFLQFDNNGRYSIKVQVNNEDSTASISSRSKRSSRGLPLAPGKYSCGHLWARLRGCGDVPSLLICRVSLWLQYRRWSKGCNLVIKIYY